MGEEVRGWSIRTSRRRLRDRREFHLSLYEPPGLEPRIGPYTRCHHPSTPQPWPAVRAW